MHTGNVTHNTQSRSSHQAEEARPSQHDDAAVRAEQTKAFRSHRQELQAGLLGMKLFLLSLAVFFASLMLGFLILRIDLRHDWPDGLPPMPLGMWVATVLLIVSSGTMQRALNSIRANQQRALVRLLSGSLLLGTGFLVLQAFSWMQLLAAMVDIWADHEHNRFALTSFFVLSGVHALHIIGGILPMLLVTLRARQGRYSAERHQGVTYCTMYWHFLGVVWIVVFLCVLIAL